MNNRRQVSNFLELIKRSDDPPSTTFYPAEAIDDRPARRAGHTFIVKDDVAGRGLNTALMGSLDQHWPYLDRINIERRAGIFLALDPASAIVAGFVGEQTRGFPVDPSLSVSYGWSAGPERGELWTHVWLLSQDAKKMDRADIAAQLRIYGARDVAVSGLVRIPGFHARLNEPVLVRFTTAPDSGSDQATIRYDPEYLHRTFLQKAAA